MIESINSIIKGANLNLNFRLFDPSKRNENKLGAMNNINQLRIDLEDQDEEDWEVKTTSKGFLYFKLKDTNDCQWEFPRVYDHKTGKYKSVFLQDWVKIRNSKTGAAFWKNSKTGLTQTVNPRSETYIFESAMLNNIAFLELYYQYGGDINLFDNKKRTPLHHA
jgi:hypothetical protein